MSLTTWLSKRLRPASRSSSKRRTRRALRTFRPGLECLEDRLVPSVLPVTSSVDDVSKFGTLRYAVANAQDGDTILLTGAVGRTGIRLTQGELLLTQQDLTIASASKPNPVTIDGGGISRIFEVAGGASVTLANLNVTGGDGLAGKSPQPYDTRGGGIVVDELASLTITGCTVSDNSAGKLGGGIADYGSLTVSSRWFSRHLTLK